MCCISCFDYRALLGKKQSVRLLHAKNWNWSDPSMPYMSSIVKSPSRRMVRKGGWLCHHRWEGCNEDLVMSPLHSLICCHIPRYACHSLRGSLPPPGSIPVVPIGVEPIVACPPEPSWRWGRVCVASSSPPKALCSLQKTVKQDFWFYDQCQIQRLKAFQRLQNAFGGLEDVAWGSGGSMWIGGGSLHGETAACCPSRGWHLGQGCNWPYVNYMLQDRLALPRYHKKRYSMKVNPHPLSQV